MPQIFKINEKVLAKRLGKEEREEAIVIDRLTFGNRCINAFKVQFSDGTIQFAPRRELREDKQNEL